jgi:hypothetical protein
VLQPSPKASQSAWVQLAGDRHPRDDHEVVLRLLQLLGERLGANLKGLEASAINSHARRTSTGAEQQSISGELEIMHRRIGRPPEDRTADRPEEVVQRGHPFRHPRFDECPLTASWRQLTGLERKRVNGRQECREASVQRGTRRPLSVTPRMSGLETTPRGRRRSAHLPPKSPQSRCLCSRPKVVRWGGRHRIVPGCREVVHGRYTAHDWLEGWPKTKTRPERGFHESGRQVKTPIEPAVLPTCFGCASVYRGAGYPLRSPDSPPALVMRPIHR